MGRNSLAALTAATVVAASTLTGCYQKGTLDGTQVEQVKVEGRLFEVRIGPTGTPDEYRMLIVRATMVVNPDAELEQIRAREVSRRYMASTCKGRDYEEILAGLQGDINYRVLFRCK
jgi:hypothetical protein